MNIRERDGIIDYCALGIGVQVMYNRDFQAQVMLTVEVLS